MTKATLRNKVAVITGHAELIAEDHHSCTPSKNSARIIDRVARELLVELLPICGEDEAEGCERIGNGE